MSRPPTPELRVLLALDELRDALGAVFSAREPERGSPNALLTLTETARRLGVARSTVTRWADAGRIVAVGPRNARRVPASALAAVAAPALSASGLGQPAIAESSAGRAPGALLLAAPGPVTGAPPPAPAQGRRSLQRPTSEKPPRVLIRLPERPRRGQIAMPRRPDPTPSSARRKSPARFPFLGLVPRPRRGRSADVATIRRLAERADGLALILEAVHKRAEATAARNIAAELRQAVP